MNRRVIWLLGVAGLLAGALAVDRLVLSNDDSTPVRTANRDTGSAAFSKSARQKATHTKRADPATGFDPQILALQKYSEIWQRPLFSKSRQASVQRPIAGNTRTAASENANGPPDFKVVGIAIRPDGGSALIRLSPRELVKVMQGDAIEGWTIESFTADSVTVVRERERWALPVGSK